MPKKLKELSFQDFWGPRKKLKTQHLINLMIDNKYEPDAIKDSALHFVNEVLIHKSPPKTFFKSLWKYRIKKEISKFLP
jgi:hypothetical protein